MYTVTEIDMSKVRLNITISEEARNILGDTPSQTIEELVSSRGNEKDVLINEMKYQADRIIEELKHTPRLKSVKKVPTRTSTDILFEINQIDRNRDEALEGCQDEGEIVRIGNEFEKKKQELLAEYQEVKND